MAGESWGGGSRSGGSADVWKSYWYLILLLLIMLAGGPTALPKP